MILNTLDKVLFASLLLTFFQLPLITNDYLQFINGYYLSTKSQVDGFKLNAETHEYTDVYAMVEDFKKNPNPAIRMDGEQKEQTLKEYEALEEGLSVLTHGNIVEKAMYMFNPERWEVLEEVMKNFKPGIPLTIYGLASSLLAALVLAAILMWPLNLLFKR